MKMKYSHHRSLSSCGASNKNSVWRTCNVMGKNPQRDDNGRSSMLHQVTPVLSGVRKSLVIWACSDVKPI